MKSAELFDHAFVMSIELTNRVDSVLRSIPQSLKMLQLDSVKKGNFRANRKSHLGWKLVVSLALGQALNIALLSAMRQHCESKFDGQNEKVTDVWTRHIDCSTIDFFAYIVQMKRFDDEIRSELEKVKRNVFDGKIENGEQSNNSETEIDEQGKILQTINDLSAFIESNYRIIRFMANIVVGSVNAQGNSPVVWNGAVDRALPTQWIFTKCNVQLLRLLRYPENSINNIV